MCPGIWEFTWGVIGVRRGDLRAHFCFDFIDDGLGGGDLLFQSAEVTRRPELVKSNVKKNTGNEIGFGGLAIPRKTMSEKKKLKRDWDLRL